MEPDRLQKLMDLLKEQGIQVTTEQAEQLLASSNLPGDGSEADKMESRESIPYQMINGYKVVVSYEPITEEEMKMKKAMVARIIANSMTRFNK